MIKIPHMGLLMELHDRKNLSDERKQKISVTSAALNLITVAIGTEGSTHKLADEMDRLDDYVKKIEATLK